MSGNLTAVREMSGILLKIRETSGKSCLKLFIVICIFAEFHIVWRMVTLNSDINIDTGHISLLAISMDE